MDSGKNDGLKWRIEEACNYSSEIPTTIILLSFERFYIWREQ
jgi:hypothetical protein